MRFDFFLSMLVLSIGLFTAIVKRDLVVKLVGIEIMETGVTTLFVEEGYKSRFPPLLSFLIERVDPLPQALVITSIVLGFAVLALSLVFVLYLSSVYHTTDVVKLKKRIEKDES